MQLVELHFAGEPRCDYPAIKSRAEELLGEEVDAPDPRSSDGPFVIFHKQHPIQLKDAVIAAQTVLFRLTAKPAGVEAYADEIQQSWRFAECAAVLATTRQTLVINELMARLLPPADRVQIFHGVLQSVIELTKPTALVFRHSQQVVSPQDYLDCAGDPPFQRPGSLNVRFFNISSSPGDMLMDTRGLTEVGLHDLQCHFRDLDPNEVSRVLLNTALYVFENGAVIESGNTVRGIGDESKWICQFERALVAPERDVLDLNPGTRYAAGRE